MTYTAEQLAVDMTPVQYGLLRLIAGYAAPRDGLQWQRGDEHYLVTRGLVAEGDDEFAVTDLGTETISIRARLQKTERKEGSQA